MNVLTKDSTKLLQVEEKNSRKLIIEKCRSRYFLYLATAIITPESVSGGKAKPIVISFNQRQKINNQCVIYIADNQGVGLSSSSERFLYFSWPGKDKERRYRLKNHPRLKNFFAITEMDEEDWQTLLSFVNEKAGKETKREKAQIKLGKKLTQKQELKKQVVILIASGEEYLDQINQCLTELKKNSRKETSEWTSKDISDIDGNFNALKDMLVFGDLEDEIPVLLERLEDYEEEN